MRSTTLRKLGVVTALVAGTAAATVLPAQAQSSSAASLGYCRDMGYEGSDWNALCARVTGINSGSYLGARTGPHYSNPVVTRYYNGNIVEIDCWTTGDGAADKPSYTYWMGLYGGSGLRYVNDWYLDTGSAGAWKSRLTHC